MVLSFLNYQIFKIMNKNITFIKIPSEISAGTRGASLGPDAIKTASLNHPDKKAREYFNPSNRKTITLPDRNDMLLDTSNEIRHRWAKRIDGLPDVYKNIAKTVKATLLEKLGTFPIVLAGDHGTATATIKGVTEAYPGEKIGVIWVDAHGDLHSPYTTPSGNMHGMTLALALGESNIENTKKDRKKELGEDGTDKLWKKLVDKYGRVISYNQVVMIGLRDTELEEKNLLRKRRVKQIPVRTMREEGYDIVGQQAIEHLQKTGCTRIYISFDVDSLDQTISRGTGTPVIDGLAKWEAIELLNYLLDQKKIPVACLEVVEVNPTLDDKKNKMAEVAFELLYNITGAIERDSVEVFNRFVVTDY